MRTDVCELRKRKDVNPCVSIRTVYCSMQMSPGTSNTTEIRCSMRTAYMATTYQSTGATADIGSRWRRRRLQISGGGGGSRTRVRRCYWSRDYMLSRIPRAPSGPKAFWGNLSPLALRTDKTREPLAR